MADTGDNVASEPDPVESTIGGAPESEPTVADAASATMIYPIRSLLSDVLPSPVPVLPTPGREQATWLPATDQSEPLRRNTSIQQRRTAQWQANMSDRHSAGRLSSPSSPQTPHRQLSTNQSPSNEPSVSAPSPAPSSTPVSEPSSAPEPEEDTVDHQLTRSNVDLKERDETATPSGSSARTGSFAAGGYVHLGPIPTREDASEVSVRSNFKSLSSGLDASISAADVSLPVSGSDSFSGEIRSQSQQSATSSDYPKTTRFQHIETENGHHILLGRDGILERCEDEPIHTPGAVQGFGVLIALEEDLESGTLTVRQVSENCTEILGLSPSYLFNLDCFTHTLPQQQADNLWDNIQYLSEPSSYRTEDPSTDEAPQVFLLNGYGQPGSAIPPDDSDDPDSSSGYNSSRQLSSRSRSHTSTSSTERRQWSCWCAAHSPRIIPPSQAHVSQNPSSSGAGASTTLAPSVSPSSSANTGSGTGSTPKGGGSLHEMGRIILLELELEHDIFNPLYPPQERAKAGTPTTPSSPVTGASSSRGSGSGSGSGGGLSGGRNSAGSDSDRTTMPAAGTPDGTTPGVEGHERPILESVDEGNDDNASPTVADPQPDAEGDANAEAETSSPDPDADPTPTPNTAAGAPSRAPAAAKNLHIGGPGDADEDPNAWEPTMEQILASTTTRAQPIRALERMRQAERLATQRRIMTMKRGGQGGRPRIGRLFASVGSGSLDVFSVLGQVNEQLSSATDLQTFLDVGVGIVKDLTQFHRVLIYQFDEIANGQVVAELVDWTQTQDLYRGLHFPAADIPPQAREMYRINKVRSLYDRGQTTARLVGRTKADIETPLDLTHSYLRAMSPIHLKYLGNMGVRGSMSISIVVFGQLWGLICCHSYGDHGMRVSFPVRQMLRLLGDSISRNIERLSYTQRLHTRKLINTIPTEAHPTGHIVSNAEDLIGLFDADFGVLVIGEGAKILGPNESGQDVLIIAEYLRVKQFKFMQVSQDITKDFPDISLRAGPNVIAGVLYVPLSAGGKDFIAFLRKGQLREVTWAGRANKSGGGTASLQPRTSFKAWSETVSTRSRAWTDEQLETAGVLALVYGKFIDVWRQKETAVKATRLTNLLLSNASHEVRTPLNHIINYLELALNGPLDGETRDNLNMSHAASKNLLFTINDLLDLTRLESGNETSLNEPFHLPVAIEDAVQVYMTEAERRNIQFFIDTSDLPKMVTGDSKKIRTVVANLTANAVKFTEKGEVRVETRRFTEPEGLRDSSQVVIEITVSDTGCGIEAARLESIFRELEQVEHSSKVESTHSDPGLGLGLAVVAHVVGQLGGQLRADSTRGVGSKFVVLIPFTLPRQKSSRSSNSSSRALSIIGSDRGSNSMSRNAGEIDSLVEALGSSTSGAPQPSPVGGWVGQANVLVADARTDPTSAKAMARSGPIEGRTINPGEVEVNDSNYPIRSIKVDPVELPVASGVPQQSPSREITQAVAEKGSPRRKRTKVVQPSFASDDPRYKVLIVEDDFVNRSVLEKRLKLDGHTVSTSVNGQEAVELIAKDRAFDCILMDIQMPILDGFGAAEQIRAMEKANPLPLDAVRPSADLNNGIPIFAVSASLKESQREFMIKKGMDAWILKPIDFKRLSVLMRGVTDVAQRNKDLWIAGCSWEKGGWMHEPAPTIPATPPGKDKKPSSSS